MEESDMEEVVVLGTRIRRRDFDSVSPIFTLSAEQLELSGTTLVEDILNDATQFTPAYDRTSNNPGNGMATLNLRGLGANRSLILINGRRVMPTGAHGVLDVNQIPSALIKNVEVLTGGASSVYGSDAMSGAINFELNNQYSGWTFQSQQDVFGKGDGHVSDSNISYGRSLSDGLGSLIFYIGYQTREEVMAGDRSHTRFPYADDWATGEITAGGSFATPEGQFLNPYTAPWDPAATWITFLEDGSSVEVDASDSYNYAPDNYLQVPLRRSTSGLFFNHDLSDQLAVQMELMWSDVRVQKEMAPTPAINFFNMTIEHPLLLDNHKDLLRTWSFDGGETAWFAGGKRLLQAGPRGVTYDSKSWRALFSLQGMTNGGYEWEAYWLSSRSWNRDEFRNAVRSSRIQQGLLVDPLTGECLDPSNGCQPITLFGLNGLTQEALAFIKVDDVYQADKMEEQVVSYYITGQPLSYSDLKVAVGAEWRRQEGMSRASAQLLEGDLAGYSASNGVDGVVELWEAYAELFLPLVSDKSFAESIDLEWGFRFSNYDEVDNDVTWKLGINWQFNHWLSMRAMRQKAVRAPNIVELYTETSVVPDIGVSENDYCSAEFDPVGNGLSDLCIAQGIPASQLGVFQSQVPSLGGQVSYGGGNPNLVSEEAETLTVGFVFQPNIEADLSVSIDYFDIQIDNSIGGIPGVKFLCFELKTPNNPYCQLIERNPLTYNIQKITRHEINHSLLETSGVDLQLIYQREVSWFGRAADLGMRLQSSRVIELGHKAHPLAAYRDCSGVFGSSFKGHPCGKSITPELKSNLSIAYKTDTLTLQLAYKYISDLSSQIKFYDQTVQQTSIRKVDSYGAFDLSFGYVISDQFRVWGGVSNLLEEDPPFLADNGASLNTTPEVFDVFGRRFFFGLSYSHQ